MDLEVVKTLSCEELEDKLQRGGLDPRIINLIKGQTIAGRHIARAKNLRKVLNLTVGDFMDFEEALEKGMRCTGSESSSVAETPNSFISSDQNEENKSDSEKSLNVSLDTDGLVTSEERDDGDGVPLSGSSTSSSILLPFASREVVEKMDHYPKKVAKSQAKFFNEMASRGIAVKRPLIIPHDTPPKLQRQRNVIDMDSPQTSSFHPSARSGASELNNVFTIPSVGGKDKPSTSRAMDMNAIKSTPRTGLRAPLTPLIVNVDTPQLPKKRSNKAKSPPKKDIMEEHKSFLEADNLDEPQKALIKDYLQNPLNFVYSIFQILDSNEDLKDEWQLLRRDGVLFGKEFDKVLRALVQHLYSLVPNANLVVPEMRECLAVSLVATFPKFGLKPTRDTELPWSWLYNRNCNTGKIANIVQNKQRGQKEQRLRGGGTDRRKRSASAGKEKAVVPLLDQVPDSDLSKDAKFLKLLAANDTNKNDIIAKLGETFQERRNLLCDGKYTVNAVLRVFHHLRSFKGEMLELEFRKLYNGKENNFLFNFPDTAVKILALRDQNPNVYQDCCIFQDDHLNAMLILKKYLPKPVKCYPWENLMDPVGKVSDLIEVIPVGSNVQNAIEIKRQHAKGNIQPYILAIGTNDKLESFMIVLGDSQVIQLPRKSVSMRAVDLLFKVHFVMNVHYTLAWKNVYRFLAAHVYSLPPENKKLSLFTEKWLKLNAQS